MVLLSPGNHIDLAPRRISFPRIAYLAAMSSNSDINAQITSYLSRCNWLTRSYSFCTSSGFADITPTPMTGSGDSTSSGDC
jgi:hypothetical protein